MKNYTVENALGTTSIEEARTRLGLSDNALLNLYFDSGIKYLEILKHKVTKKQVFDVMLRPILDRIGSMKPSEVFKKITYSPVFWAWWSAQLWCVCNEKQFNDATELFYRCQFNNAIIPPFILKQIFHVKQNTERRPGFDPQPENKANQIEPGKREAGAAVTITVLPSEMATIKRVNQPH